MSMLRLYSGIIDGCGLAVIMQYYRYFLLPIIEPKPLCKFQWRLPFILDVHFPILHSSLSLDTMTPTYVPTSLPTSTPTSRPTSSPSKDHRFLLWFAFTYFQPFFPLVRAASIPTSLPTSSPSKPPNPLYNLHIIIFISSCSRSVLYHSYHRVHFLCDWDLDRLVLVWFNHGSQIIDILRAYLNSLFYLFCSFYTHCTTVCSCG